jgi:epoxide hydrolase 4
LRRIASLAIFSKSKMQNSFPAWQHAYTSTNGIRLHYVTQGEGSLMLMLHGFPEFWYSWRHQIPVFAESHKVVAVDLRGYNDSDKPAEQSAYRLSTLVEDIKGLIQGLGYERCILVGHDWGGVIAWAFASAYPECLERLIILNVPHPAKFSEGLRTLPQLLKSWYVLFFQLPLLPEWILSQNTCALLAKILTQTATSPATFPSEAIAAYREAAAKPGAIAAMLNYYRDLFQSGGFKKDWGILQPPTLLIWGENDVALGKELTLGTQAYVRDLQIRYIPNCSHWVQQEKPQVVNQYIREWLG